MNTGEETTGPSTPLGMTILQKGQDICRGSSYGRNRSVILTEAKRSGGTCGFLRRVSHAFKINPSGY